MKHFSYFALLTLSLTAASCHSWFYSDSELFCEMNPGDDRCPDGGSVACATNQDCTSGSTPVCDVAGTMTCVECLPDQADACQGATPSCGSDHQCVGCTSHLDCAATSNVCRPDGSCANEQDVAYVKMGGSGSACTQAVPCATLGEGLAAKNVVKVLSGLVKGTNLTTIDGKQVAIFADAGAKLDRDGDGPILEVRGNADVTISDLEITGQSGIGDSAISVLPSGGTPKLTLARVMVVANQGLGISSSGGTLTVSRSTISGNTGGGMSITNNTQFDLSNNIIAGNGGASTGFGGVRFDQTSSGTRVFEFNTVSNNVAADGTATGVVCSLVTQAVTFSNNIIYDNASSGTRTQVGGTNCSWTYSDIGPGLVPGNANVDMDPMFVNAGQNNFHLQATSPVKDAADPNATLGMDIDGEPRPQGTADIGADEIP